MLFREAPEDFKKDIDVVGCYLEHMGKVALLLRPSHKSNGARWGLPAGKVEGGESLISAMQRELLEETGLAVDASKLVPAGTFYVVHSGRSLVFHTFALVCRERPPVVIHTDEHEAVRWVTPQAALALPLVVDQDECLRMHYGI